MKNGSWVALGHRSGRQICKLEGRACAHAQRNKATAQVAAGGLCVKKGVG